MPQNLFGCDRATACRSGSAAQRRTGRDRRCAAALSATAPRRSHPSITPQSTNRQRPTGERTSSDNDAAFPRLNSIILFSYKPFKRHTIFTELFIQPAVAGSTVRVSCSGRGCFKSKSVKVRTAKRKLNLSRLVRRARLRPRARLEIRITKPGTIGIVRRLTVRAGKRPTTTILCIAPGATKPSACPD